ncbi:type III pantothenate kinase [Marinobacter sp. S6332]|uniref:type III pantothenate kinase n=1 Tax=Marinobacter sp. S6332 TaxID=2926403 RepID=UPI001FF6A667|nr:type III pantothenate kinase [Marinobacter sp. S6332]MCK0165861.1 type III pantothenate kinase [Marinobacter sp. S6332]
MRLLIDAGNSRLKWRLDETGGVIAQGLGGIEDADPLSGLPVDAVNISRIAVSTVASEEKRLRLLQSLSSRVSAPIRCYWSEACRNGLASAYRDYQQMGADRWHAMYGAWLDYKQGFIVVDAGSAITVDYVGSSGQHLGGFILPGLHMMRRSLQVDAARIDFDPSHVSDRSPGKSTSECVNHGLAWLSSALIDRVHSDSYAAGVRDILITGGDAERLLSLGLKATFCPSLVLDGLAAIDAQVYAG